jgi:hypothetical protein
MPRFHFHFVAPELFLPDGDGKVLASLAEAHAHALRLIESATVHFIDAHDWKGWTVRICSPENRLLLTVLFPVRAQADVNRRRLA